MHNPSSPKNWKFITPSHSYFVIILHQYLQYLTLMFVHMNVYICSFISILKKKQ